MRAIKCLPKLAESLQQAYSAHAASIVRMQRICGSSPILANARHCSQCWCSQKREKSARKRLMLVKCSHVRIMCAMHMRCSHSVTDAWFILSFIWINLVTFQRICADAASMLQAPSPLYAHYEHPVSIMHRCCEYAASTITVICTLWASCKHHVQMLGVRCKHHHPYMHVKHFWQIDVHYFNLWNTSNWKIHLLTLYLLNIYSFQFTAIVNFQIVGSYFLCFWELFC